MTKGKYIIILLFTIMVLFFIPNQSNATVTVTRDVSSNGELTFNFTGLQLDETHEYEYSLTRTSSTDVEKWFSIINHTESTAVVKILLSDSTHLKIFNLTDTGFITIKDKTTDTIVLQPYSIDLKLPYLKVTNYNVINNGKQFGSYEKQSINISCRNASKSKAFYQYEKITDENIINRYKEIKATNGNIDSLQNILKQSKPNSNWIPWDYWNGHSSMGFGYPEHIIKTPDTGLYYMWVYFSESNSKDVYGYILVDSLEPDIALESISLPSTQTLKIDETLTISPIFNPTTATNKIVTYSSSNEDIATIDNTGKITPHKVGSTIITVVSKDGNKRASCTVTVTEASNINSSNNEFSNNITSNNEIDNNKENLNSVKPKNDSTSASGKLPQTGLQTGFISILFIVIIVAIFSYFKYNKIKDIK